MVKRAGAVDLINLIYCITHSINHCLRNSKQETVVDVMEIKNRGGHFYLPPSQRGTSITIMKLIELLLTSVLTFIRICTFSCHATYVYKNIKVNPLLIRYETVSYNVVHAVATTLIL